jgi:hypothetical protein
MVCAAGLVSKIPISTYNVALLFCIGFFSSNLSVPKPKHLENQSANLGLVVVSLFETIPEAQVLRF